MLPRWETSAEVKSWKVLCQIFYFFNPGKNVGNFAKYLTTVHFQTCCSCRERLLHLFASFSASPLRRTTKKRHVLSSVSTRDKDCQEPDWILKIILRKMVRSDISVLFFPQCSDQCYLSLFWALWERSRSWPLYLSVCLPSPLDPTGYRMTWTISRRQARQSPFRTQGGPGHSGLENQGMGCAMSE